MAKYRTIVPHIWDDRWFGTLKAEERVYWFYLLTNQNTEPSGVYHHPLYAHLQVGVTPNKLKKIQQKFEADEKAFFEDEWVLILNYMQHQPVPNDSMWRRIDTQVTQCPHCLLTRWCDRYWDRVQTQCRQAARARNRQTNRTETEQNRTDKPTEQSVSNGSSSCGGASGSDGHIPAFVGRFLESLPHGQRQRLTAAFDDRRKMHGGEPLKTALLAMNANLEAGTKIEKPMRYFQDLFQTKCKEYAKKGLGR